MAILLKTKGILFVPAAKIACTSIKKFFFHIENGREFEPMTINGNKINAHKLYKSGMLARILPAAELEKLYRVTLVRDPIKRFLSAYSNRVNFHKELSVKKAGENLKNLDLQPDPDIHLFIERFDEYKKANRSINRHTMPLVEFLGADPGYYNKIYCISEIEDFRQDIVQRVGMDLKMPYAQTGGKKVDINTLSESEIDKIRQLYKEDYETYGSFIKS
ncbi:MAG: sulfotransferase family 2 domain-containing protein [Lentilitoribacter sp.]